MQRHASVKCAFIKKVKKIKVQEPIRQVTRLGEKEADPKKKPRLIHIKPV